MILPAFVLTAILDSIGATFSPTLYRYDTGVSFSNSAISYLLSAFFLGHSWTLLINPGSDLPFWSLNYEAWYYVIFACAVFFSGKRRLLLLVAAVLLTGPKILLLFPIWLMGVVAWHIKERVSLRLGRILVLAAVASFAGLEVMGGQKLFPHADTPWLPHRFSGYDYIIGLIVAVLICGIAKARLPMPGPRLTRATHALAGTTFGLYLFHYPLLCFFGTVLPGESVSFVHRILLFVLTLGASLALAALTEQRKDSLKRFLRLVLSINNSTARTTVIAPVDSPLTRQDLKVS